MLVQPATEADLPRVMEIFEALNLQKKRSFRWTSRKKLLEDLDELYVCGEDSRIHGAMSLFLGGHSRIMALAVSPQSRYLGAGGKLVDFAIDAARKRSTHLWVGSEFAFRADKFYLKKGFSLYSSDGSYEFVIRFTS